MEWAVLLSFAGALLAIIDPVGNLPIFVGYVGQEKQAVQRLLAVFICLAVMIGLLLFFFIGQYILNFFGISMAAFQIAGGILLLLIGVDMLRGQNFQKPVLESEKTEHTTFGQARRKFHTLLIPLGVPLFVGPGSISTVTLYAARAPNVLAMFELAMVIIVVSIITGAVLWMGRGIHRLLGPSGMDIVTRLLGLLLASIAVQFMLAGMSSATNGFIVASPPAATQPMSP